MSQKQIGTTFGGRLPTERETAGICHELYRSKGFLPFSLQVGNFNEGLRMGKVQGALNCFIGEIVNLSKCEKHIKEVYGV